MKAFTYGKYRPPQTFRMTEAGKPAPDAGEILVKCWQYRSLQRTGHSMRGKPLFSRATLGLPGRGKVVVEMA